VVVHAETAPHLTVSVEQDRETVTVMIADDCPQIPEHERSVFERATEHPLDHSTGVGLWLVQLIMESYDGSVRLETSDAGGNRVDLVFRAASGEGADPLGTHLRRLLDR
jgi:K+-sensing histidine kinase KdpD